MSIDYGLNLGDRVLLHFCTFGDRVLLHYSIAEIVCTFGGQPNVVVDEHGRER